MMLPRAVRLLLAAAGLLAGCNGAAAPPPDPRPADATATTAGPNSPPRDGEVMALVNGKPLYMAGLHEVLLDAYGLDMAQQLVGNEVVAQALAREEVTLDDADVRAEEERTLREIFGDEFSPDQRERLLAQALARRRVARRHWELTVRRNAMLRKLAEPRVRITEEDLREEFGDRFGRKVVVRHIQTESLSQAQRILAELRKQGADFAKLAKKYSRNVSAGKGGLLEPITRKGPPAIPSEIRQAALALRRPGEISDPVKVGTAYHVLKLERIIQPEDKDFQAVKDALRDALHARRMHAMQQAVLRRLLADADVRYVDRRLREKHREAAP
jgi:hypothetical protein